MRGFKLNFEKALVLLLVAFSTTTPSLLYAQVRVWANDGGNKVTQNELRAASPSSVINSVWNGSKVQLFGAKNEVVAFNLVIEAPTSRADNVSVQFDQLSGPNGYSITSRAASGDGVFNWQGRNIELFYVRYLQIKGISTNTISNYDERHTPERMRRPWSGAGIASGTWNDRKDHDKYYPDIAVPLELNPRFTINAGSNQSIWADIYIPKTTASGVYTGNINVSVNGANAASVPVQLTVRNFSLPDSPTTKTMAVYSPYEVNQRYHGTGYINPLGSTGPKSIETRQRHFMLAHRHKISLIDTNYEFNSDQPAPYEWPTRLDGSLFTPANGYDGPGVSVGNNVFAIGVYGSWVWKGQDQSSMWQHTNNWEQWFQSNSPSTERFLYLDDESKNYSQLQQWASWIKNNPGVGRNLLSMATIDLPHALSSVPSLSAVASTIYIGDPNTWGPAQQSFQSTPGNRFFTYNGHRPASGSFAIEDDGVSPRQIAWTQYKMKINRWYYWQTTYYNNAEGGTGQTNVFQSAQTFGGYPYYDSAKGMTSNGYSNGDGVLFYPGKDTLFPNDSYNVNGPIASLRLKNWRRGIQDTDYLALANAINPTATKQIIDAVIPKVLWEYGVDDPRDPTWKRTDISWSNDPDVWEQARSSLASIIESGSPSTPPVVQPQPNTPPSGGTGGAVSAPSNLGAQALVSNQIVLSWSDNSSNETGFKIERSMDGTNFTEVGTAAANATSYSDNGLNAWTTYAYKIRAANGSTYSSYTPVVYRTTLTTNGAGTSGTGGTTPTTSGTAPSAPTGVNINALVSNQLEINWTDSSNNESGFKIERSMNGVNFTEVGSVGANATKFNDTGLNAWTTYAYRIRAYNASGNSAYTALAYKTTLTTNSPTTPTSSTDTSAPAAPSGLTATYAASMSANLNWRDNSSNETGFRIERSTDGTNFTTVATVGANTTSYTNSSLSRWTTYVFRVRAVNGSTASAPSNNAYVSMPQ